MNGRQLPAADYFALKGATRQLVTASGRGPKAAVATRVRQQQLSEYGQADHRLFMPIDVVADLEAEAGPVVTEQLALLCNHILVPLPAVALDGAPLDRVSAEALKEIGDVFVALGAARADGAICSKDAAGILDEIHGAIAKLALLKLQVEAEAGGEA
jgi:hypothetical protein